MSSRKQSDAPEDFTTSGAHVQTPGGADIVPSKTTFDFNSSLIVADLNSSVFDGKKQLELSSILAQQEKLLLEKNYEHKEILEDYKHLKEQFIMKDTETSRLKRLLQEQKEEVDAYKAKVKTQHEEIVVRVRLAEETVKELAGFSTALGKIVLSVYGLGTRHFNEILNGVNNFTNFREHLDSHVKDLDRAYKPLLEKYQTNPKRILSYLEEAKSTMNAVKDKMDGKSWMENLAELCKSREEEKRERGSIRRQSLKMQMSMPSSGSLNSRLISEEDLQKLSSDSKSILELVLQKFSELGTYLATAPSAGHNSLQNPKKLSEPDSRVCSTLGQLSLQLHPYLEANLPKLEKPVELGLQSKMAVLHEEFKTTLSGEIDGLQGEIQIAIAETDHLHEEITPKLRLLCSLKEQIRTGKAELETLQQSLRTVEDENQVLQQALDDLKSSSSSTKKLLDEDRREKMRISELIQAEEESIYDSKHQIAVLQKQIETSNDLLKELRKQSQQFKHQMQYLLNLRKQSEQEIEKVQYELEFPQAQNELSPISTKQEDSHTRNLPAGIKSPFTTAKKQRGSKDRQSAQEADSTTGVPQPANANELIEQTREEIEVLEGKVAVAAAQYAEPQRLWKELWTKKGQLEAELIKLNAQTLQLTSLNSEYQSVDQKLKETVAKNATLTNEIALKTKQLHQLQSEELVSRENYTRDYLKLEATQQRLLSVQAQLEKLASQTTTTQKQTASKTKELLRLEASPRPREMVRLNDNSEPLLEEAVHPQDKHSHVEQQTGVGEFPKMLAACFVAIGVAFMFYKLGLL